MELNNSLLSISFLVVTFIYCVLFLLRTNTKQKSNLPPGPKGFPIIGNLLDIGDRPHVTFTKLAETYGPLMTVQLGSVTTIVASSTETVQEILQKNDLAFLGRPMPDAATAQVDYELSMGWLPGGPKWTQLRKICNTGILSTQKLDALQDLRHKICKNMMNRVHESREMKQPILIGRFMFGTVLSIFSNILFSMDVLDPKSEDADELKELIGKIMKLAAKPNLADYFPVLKWIDPQGIRRSVKPSFQRLHFLIDRMIEKRLQERENGAPIGDDFLDALLDCAEIDMKNVRTLLTDLLIGGNDSLTATMEWTMAELLHNPTVMAKAKQELSSRFGSTSSFIKEQEIQQLPYLDAIIKESMRLHPIAPLLLPHRTQEDVELHGFTIPKNTQVFVNSWSISRDERYWEEPNKFLPERFLHGSGFDFRGNRLCFLPFGTGRRICPGVSLSVRMLNLFLANLIHNFDWKLPDGIAPADMDMTDTVGILHQKAHPLVAIPV